MDQLDKKMLNLLQQDARLSIKKISEALFITAPAVSQRLRHLEEAGIIKNYQAQLHYEACHLPIKAFIQLSLSPQQKPEFYDYIQKIPNVLECDCVTGPYSQLIKVVFPTTHLLDQFINELQQFGGTNTQIVFSTPVAARGYQFAE
ncbi:Lrp/AsnC family transcriptional regulator [Enterococcus nangangensis]|uniref:Lrp/AsnC family transcriptional regulator n=1 Tax=Enterococcus nangangensis TaxID=2559926 RepID=UPI0010F4CDA6|nr:Lrp/AsnC family transcriptional regulator [Enterococcus nangangensis]